MNVNIVILAGNLTRDPQLSYTPNQMAIVNCGLAINKKYKDKESVCFVDLRFFGKTAEIINKYCKKGNSLFVRGELTFDQWTSKDGVKKSKHYIIVESFQFLGGKTEESAKSEEQKPYVSGAEQSQNSEYDIFVSPASDDDIPLF